MLYPSGVLLPTPPMHSVTPPCPPTAEDSSSVKEFRVIYEAPSWICLRRSARGASPRWQNYPLQELHVAAVRRTGYWQYGGAPSGHWGAWVPREQTFIPGGVPASSMLVLRRFLSFGSENINTTETKQRQKNPNKLLNILASSGSSEIPNRFQKMLFTLSSAKRLAVAT